MKKCEIGENSFECHRYIPLRGGDFLNIARKKKYTLIPDFHAFCD